MLRNVHTADLDAAEARRIRVLLDGAFEDGFDDADWEHCLGGLHVLGYAGGDLVAHAAVVQRRLLYRGRAVRTGYVEGVAVGAEHRGRGHAAAVMTEAERIIRQAYEIGALSSSHDAVGLYLARGWIAWQGPTFVLGPAGPVRTPEDDDSVYVFPVTSGVDITQALACDWRDGDVW
ncbi:MAG TPA: GNAT family N-acetyltransferase [Micromonosporaceae bacterium]|nr:GNAT family N-acetyltransferase [Micromonosporaceae bacterium]